MFNNRRFSLLCAIVFVLLLINAWIFTKSGSVSFNKSEQVRKSFKRHVNQRKGAEQLHGQPKVVDNLPDDFEVPGWGRDVPRDVARYLKPGVETAILRPRLQFHRHSSELPRLLIAIISAPDNFSLRDLIRQNQASACKHTMADLQCDYLFILGRSNDSNSQERVVQEAHKHKDILMEDFTEDYYNLTIKSLFMLKFFLEDEERAQHTHLIKMDDDCFFNPFLLQRLVRQQLQIGDDFIMGQLVPPLSPRRDINIRDSYFGKFLAPRYLYSGDLYPSYMATFYVLSRLAAECIWEATHEESIFFIEDIYITGILASHCQDVRRVDLPESFIVRPSPRPTVQFLPDVEAAIHLKFEPDYVIDVMPKLWNKASGHWR